MRAWILGLVCVVGCGAEGSYQGRSVWSVTLQGQTQNTEEVDVRQVYRGSRTDVVIASADCDLPADVSASGLTVQPTTCAVYRDGQRLELTFSGTGALDRDDRLSLSLSGPITVSDASGSYPGTFTYTFEGDRL